jgi:hypothetical protein
MAVRSIKNQYPGINAHLHSYWQSKHGWTDFHVRYIVRLTDVLLALLLPMGYNAAIEFSLQTRQINDEPESLLFDTPFRAIQIHQNGQPVVWMEVLTPSNKPGGRYAAEYTYKRIRLLEQGMVLVEIDILHESPPVLQRLPTYPDDHASSPYLILVSDPRPTFQAGTTRVYPFSVDDALRIVSVELNDDSIAVDFDAPYQETLTKVAYGLELVDYSQLPLHFERYSADDQARIANRMLAVIEAAQAGLDLETGPFPAQTLPLEEALKRLKNE